MRMNHNDYKVVPYPKIRRLLSLMMSSVQRKHMIHDLIEVDVTRARRYLREHKAKTGESLSFTAFITSCLVDRQISFARRNVLRWPHTLPFLRGEACQPGEFGFPPGWVCATRARRELVASSPAPRPATARATAPGLPHCAAWR